MNNTLTVKEWVDKLNRDEDSQWSNYDCNYPMMEKYANYKNRILEDRIKEFRQLMAKPWFEDGTDYPTGIWIAEFDRVFNN